MTGREYSIALLDRRGLEMAGASMPCRDDEMAELEAEALASMHDWCTRAVIRHKGTDRSWSIQING